METRDSTTEPIRRRSRPRTRSLVPVPLWAAVTGSILTLWIGIGIGLAVEATPTPCPQPPVVAIPLPGTPTGSPITPMRLGETITLGDTTGINFTVTQATDPAVAKGSVPSPGYRFLAVKLTITNTTGSTWRGDGVPDAHSVIIDSNGHQYGAVEAFTALAPSFAADLALPAGGSVTGAVVFQVPATVAVTGVQIALTSDGGAVGLWMIS